MFQATPAMCQVGQAKCYPELATVAFVDSDGRWNVLDSDKRLKPLEASFISILYKQRWGFDLHRVLSNHEND
jgi:hypothetical protein